MSIAIIVTIIELVSILVKIFFPSLAKLLPIANTIIGVVASLIMGTDVLTGLATAGITCAGYDIIHGTNKAILQFKMNKENAEIEKEINES